mmetsp:Transcript_1843/g.2461  ORF Transcript_1843/g.2461 Transcript_1843/m.2461 type:complete len:129 (-) Transcript_1843:11-397(-)
MCIGAITETEHHGYCWVDPVVSLICGVVSLIYGSRGIYKAHRRNRLPIFTLSWWLYNENSGKTVGGGDDDNEDVERKREVQSVDLKETKEESSKTSKETKEESFETSKDTKEEPSETIIGNMDDGVIV